MLVRKGRRKAGLDWMDGVRMCAVKCHNIWCQPDVFDLTVLGKRMSNDRDLMCACGAKYMGGRRVNGIVVLILMRVKVLPAEKKGGLGQKYDGGGRDRPWRSDVTRGRGESGEASEVDV